MSAVKFKFSGDSSELLKELENIKEKVRQTSGEAAKVRVGKGASADVEGLGSSFKKLLPSVTAAVAGVASFGTALSVIKMGIKDAMDDARSYVTPIAGFKRPSWLAKPLFSGALGMVATGYKISRHSPKEYKVTVTYSYPAGETREDEDENEAPDNPDNPDGSENKYKVKISDRSNTTFEPILSYYKLRNTDGSSKYPERDMLMLAVYLSGGLTSCDNGQYRLKCEPDDTPGHLQLPDTPMTPLILRGLKKVSQNNTVITISYTARGVDPSKVGRVGKIVQGGEFGGLRRTAATRG